MITDRYSSSLTTLPLASPRELLDYEVDAKLRTLLHPFKERKFARSSKSKFLVCHDMRGNYLNDRFNLGSSFKNAYQIMQWDVVDFFCYFSHNMVTIPPLSWINAAHHHGSKIMGTFITEWDQGAKNCHELFGTESAAKLTAAKLIAIAQDYLLDGWLINIENKLKTDGEVQNMQIFLTELTSGMHKLHPESKVIWYDAVTVDGSLAWQDGLTAANKPFFDSCDGLFVNYTWTDASLESSAQMATDRKHDLYYGIDVFGRGTPGRGGFDCGLAVQVLVDQGLSVALFAPGWLLETQVDETAKFDAAQHQIVTLSLKFWHDIIRVWRQREKGADTGIHTATSIGAGGGSSQMVAVVPSAGAGTRGVEAEKLSLPQVCICFSQGAGKYVFVHGLRFRHWSTWNEENKEADLSGGFYDLSLQDMRWDVDALEYSPLPSTDTHTNTNTDDATIVTNDVSDGYVLVSKGSPTAHLPRPFPFPGHLSVTFGFCYDHGYDGTSCLQLAVTMAKRSNETALNSLRTVPIPLPLSAYDAVQPTPALPGLLVRVAVGVGLGLDLSLRADLHCSRANNLVSVHPVVLLPPLVGDDVIDDVTHQNVTSAVTMNDDISKGLQSASSVVCRPMTFEETLSSVTDCTMFPHLPIKPHFPKDVVIWQMRTYCLHLPIPMTSTADEDEEEGGGATYSATYSIKNLCVIGTASVSTSVEVTDTHPDSLEDGPQPTVGGPTSITLKALLGGIVLTCVKPSMSMSMSNTPTALPQPSVDTDTDEDTVGALSQSTLLPDVFQRETATSMSSTLPPLPDLPAEVIPILGAVTVSDTVHLYLQHRVAMTLNWTWKATMAGTVRCTDAFLIFDPYLLEHAKLHCPSLASQVTAPSGCFTVPNVVEKEGENEDVIGGDSVGLTAQLSVLTGFASVLQSNEYMASQNAAATLLATDNPNNALAPSALALPPLHPVPDWLKKWPLRMRMLGRTRSDSLRFELNLSDLEGGVHGRTVAEGTEFTPTGILPHPFFALIALVPSTNTLEIPSPANWIWAALVVAI